MGDFPWSQNMVSTNHVNWGINLVGFLCALIYDLMGFGSLMVVIVMIDSVDCINVFVMFLAGFKVR